MIVLAFIYWGYYTKGGGLDSIFKWVSGIFDGRWLNLTCFST